MEFFLGANLISEQDLKHIKIVIIYFGSDKNENLGKRTVRVMFFNRHDAKLWKRTVHQSQQDRRTTRIFSFVL